MKSQTVIVAAFLSLIVIDSSIGRVYMPDWAYAITIVVLIVCFVYYIFKMIYNGKTRLEEGQYALTSNITNTKFEIEKKLKDQKISFLDSLLEKQNALLQAIKECSDFVDKESAKRTELAMSRMSTLFDEIDKRIQKETEDIKALDESLKSLSTQILEKVVSENEKALNHLSQIAQSINSNRENTRSLIDDTSAKLTSLTESRIGEVEKAIEDTYASLVQKTQEHSDSLTSRVSNLVAQAASSSNSLLESLSQIQKESDSHSTQILEKVVSENEKALNHLSQIAQSINSNRENNRSLIDDTSAKLTSLTESRIGEVEKAIEDTYASLVQKTQEHSDSLTSRVSNLAAQATSSSNSLLESLSQIQKESDSLKTTVDSLLQQNSTLKDLFESSTTQLSEKVGNAVNEIGKLSPKNNNDSIVNSIKSLISELKIELQKDVDNVNKQVIDTRSLFQTTNNEVQKLQTLLNIVLKSSEDNKRGISELASINSGKPTGTTAAPVYGTPVSSKPELKPNRTETIVDSETGNTVLNKFERNVLVKSTMNNKAGHVIYEIEYNNGQIVRSKNYDPNGKLTIEQTYYDNNQVHFRYEYTKNGRITTEFDKFGNKK